MALPLRLDPLPAFNFIVQLIESRGLTITVAGFSECSGLDTTLEIQEYQEGGVNDRVHKFPSRFTFSNITLKRGITLDPALREWHLNFLRGRVERRDGLIILMNEMRLPVISWKFERGLPIKWAGPALNATTSAAAIETLEIAHEHIEVVKLSELL